MNSYSENLHASVVASLQSQELNQKQLDAQLNASMFTLYYAEGAEIDANEKLNTANKNYKKTQTIKNQAVNVKNISTNLLMSANQQNAFTTQSVTNVAVSASNIQIATNAIVRLASDMGSIYSIINAADYGTQIYQQSVEAYNLMNKTAYLAEVASQHAMEASSSIAEVASSTVADKAKLTDTSIDNLLKVASTDFSNITAIVSAENDVKVAANVNTKKAEGIIEYSKVEFEAAKVAYKVNNKRLNYNLRVITPKKSNDTYEVAFDFYKSPFTSNEKTANTLPNGLENPVKNYNLFLVKESKKSTFSISVAEDLLHNPIQHIQINPTINSESDELIEIKRLKIISTYDTYFDRLSKLSLLKTKNIELKENANKANEILKDAIKEKNENEIAIAKSTSDREKAQLELVKAKEIAKKASEASQKTPIDTDLAKASVLASKNEKTAEITLEKAKLNEKKLIDSAKVALDNLNIAKENVKNANEYVTASATEINEAEDSLDTATTVTENAQRQGYQSIQMMNLLDSDNEILVLGEKYVVFLMIVFSDDYKKGINTYDDYLSAPSESFSLKNTLDAIENISIIHTPPTNESSNSGQPIVSPYSINFTPKKQKHSDNTEYRCMFLPYYENLLSKKQLEDIEEIIEVSILKNEMNSLKNSLIQYNEEINLLNNKKETLQKDLTDLKNSKDLTKPEIAAKVEFIKTLLDNYKNAFNEVTSKQVIAQNQLDNLNMNLETTLSKIKMPVKNNKSFYFNLNLAENIPSGNYTVAKPKQSDSSTYEVKIDFTTTDNFGSPLLDSSVYIPVILSYYTGPETNKKQYNNNLSDWENENTFQFSINNNL